MKDLFIWIILPLILSNVFHMLIVKLNVFSFLSIPISSRHFGNNKTWRGFIALPILNGIILTIIYIFYSPHLSSPSQAFLIGIFVGITYLIFELPNSFLKRKLGIESGSESKKHALLFNLLDKTDSSLGVSLVSMVIFKLAIIETLNLFLLSCTCHIFFSWLLVLLGIKKRF